MQPDILLLDINLPDIDGYEVTRRLRTSESEHARMLPIIAITGSALGNDRQKVQEVGMNGFLSKPFEIRQLWGLLARFLGPPETQGGKPSPRFIEAYGEE